MKLNKVQDILIGICIIIVALGFGTYIVITMVDTASNMVVDCHEYKEVKFRYIGAGGLFGGVQEKTVSGENYDGYKEVCVKGKNAFGQDWETSDVNVLEGEQDG